MELERHRRLHQRAFTLLELLVTLILVAVLLAILLPMTAGSHRGGRQVKDATQLRQIHTAFLTWSRAFGGRFPTPGLITATLDPAGATVENDSLNTHANLYAASLSQNYFSAQLCISPAESSEKVKPATDYDYTKYAPSAGIFWDSSFRADLDTTSNLSYGTMHLAGARLTRQWRESLDSRFAVLGNRGVRDGSTDPAVYGASKTLRIHGSSNSWEGNIVYNDNHVAFETSFFSPNAAKLGPRGTVEDNFFRDDPEGAGADMWLTMIKSTVIEGNGTAVPECSWD